MGTVQIQTLQTKVKMNFMYFALFFMLAVTVKSGPNPSPKANAKASARASPKANPKADPKAKAKAKPQFMPQMPNQYPHQFPTPLTCSPSSIPCSMCAEWICQQGGRCSWNHMTRQCTDAYNMAFGNQGMGMNPGMGMGTGMGFRSGSGGKQ